MKKAIHLCNTNKRHHLQSGRHIQTTDKPLTNFLVLDFSQFLSGSLATLRLADLGARVIKIERPGKGDLGRSLYISGSAAHGENTLFQAINRNKESYAADLKNPQDMDRLQKPIARAMSSCQNFRPGVMDVSDLAMSVCPGSIPSWFMLPLPATGRRRHGGPPGTGTLAQARSGIMWLGGNEGDPPTPMALAAADMLAGHNLSRAFWRVWCAAVSRGAAGWSNQLDQVNTGFSI